MSDVPFDQTMPAPPPPPPPAAPAAPQFDFAKPFTYVFDDPRWAQKILIGGLFYLAAMLLVGIPFILGYVARVARNVVAGAQTPLPEWDDIGSFFGEGLRLFAVAAVFIIPFIAIAVMVMVPAGILGSFENEGIAALGGGLAGCLACFMLPLSLAVMIFMPASLLFAAVEQRFSAAFEMERIWSFIKANVGNYLLAVVIYVIARFIAGTGVIMLCIGVIFTGFWSFLITTHAFAQVYRVSSVK